MDKSGKKDRRDFLFTASYTVGAIGIGATVWPFIDQMNPDSSVKALASTEVDLSQIQPGKAITVLWRGKPVFIKRRTSEEIAEAKKVNLEDWHYATVDYDFLNDKTILVNSHFPEIQNNNINSKTIPELYTYFNNNNSLNKVKYIRNFKYGHSMSNLTTN